MKSCPNCGKKLSRNSDFCSACRTWHVDIEQKSALGSHAPPAVGAFTFTRPFEPAGFKVRAAAFIADGLLLGAGLFIFFFAIATAFSIGSQHSNIPLVAFFTLTTASLIIIPYFILWETSPHQSTPGKLLLGLLVVDEHDRPISFRQGVVRNVGKVLATLIGGVGLAMIATSKNKQGLHDRLAFTAVVFPQKGDSRPPATPVVSPDPPQGAFTWPNGDRYEGGFLADKPHGRGTFVSAKGDRYEGDFAAGKFHGQGSYLWGSESHSPGDCYEGLWHEGKRNGKGKLVSGNGNCYEGDFKDNKFTGQGTISVNGQIVCQGTFVQDKLQGKGVLLFPNGDRYEGNFNKDQLTGKGVLYYANGNRYEGDWLTGKRTGKGLLLLANGDRYEGEWLNNRMHGDGIYTYSDGRISQGNFKNDKYIEPQE